MKKKSIFSLFLLCTTLMLFNVQVSALNAVDVIWIQLTKKDFTSYPGHIIPLDKDTPGATFEAFLSGKALNIQFDNVESEFYVNIVSNEELVLDETYTNENNTIEIPTDDWSKGSYIIRIYYGDKMWIGEFLFDTNF